MTTKSFLACERKGLSNMKKYQLPNQFKKVGIFITVSSFIALFANKLTVDQEIYRMGARYGMLIGLLIISISKEKIEDELVAQLRMQSYTLAFIMGVAYALFLPFVDYFVDFIFQADKASVKDMGDFVILWMLLSVQVFSFELLKKLH